MKQFIILLAICLPLLGISQKKCKKSFYKNEYDEIKKHKYVLTKFVTYKKGFSKVQSLRFGALNSYLFMDVASTEKYGVDNNAEIGFLFDNGASHIVTTKDKLFSSTSSSASYHQNSVKIKSKELVDAFMSNTLKVVHQYGGDRRFEVKEKEALQIKEYFNCLVNEMGCKTLLPVKKTLKKEVTQSNYTDTSKYTFRKTNWGMSRSEVMKIEGTPLLNKENYIYYEDIYVGNMKTALLYIFSNDKLVRARYSFKEKHSNDNLYIDDFEEVNELLDKKYGEAKLQEIWKRELYKDKPDRYGDAISYGDLKLYKERVLKRSTIIHVLRGDNYKISHILEYKSNEIEEVKEDELDGF